MGPAYRKNEDLDYLDAAQNCLDNTEQCQATAASSMQSGCDNTAK